MVKVRIENSYVDGYQDSREVELPDPASSSKKDMQAWWHEVVSPETGTEGHDPEIEGINEVTIIEAADPALVGLAYSWQG